MARPHGGLRHHGRAVAQVRVRDPLLTSRKLHDFGIIYQAYMGHIALEEYSAFFFLFFLKVWPVITKK